MKKKKTCGGNKISHYQSPSHCLTRYCFLLLTLLLAGCASVDFADVSSVDPVVKIGLVAPFEGEQRVIGYDVIYATRLAVRQVNTAGGINGYRVALVAYDDSTYPSEAENVAEALIVDDGIVAVLGHWTAETNAVAQKLYADAGLAWVPMGGDGIEGVFSAEQTPDTFKQAYQAITFGGTQPPGAYAAPAYDAMQLIFEAIDQASQQGDVSRATVNKLLPSISLQGMTGKIEIPRK